MLAACEAGEVFALLEGGGGGAREAADALHQLYAAVREPWLARALLAYYSRTQSARALELLARAPDPHARHLLDALADQLRGDGPSRRAALAALAPLVARRPAWLHRAPNAHSLPRELVRAARLERRPPALLHALLALAALVPAAPALAAPHWPELADALLRPGALDPPPPPAARAHLQLAQLALFHALYATAPCTLVDTLRAELAAPAARAAWERSLRPLLHAVRLHPALLTGTRAREADAARRLEEHEIVAETRRLALRTPERRDDSPPPTPVPRPPAPPTPRPGSAAAASRAVAQLRPGAEPWFPLADRAGADSAPHTPLPAEPDAAEPPEAAVEATPENTPAERTRAAFRFPSESGAVRAIGRRKEASPPAAGEAGARLARVLAERRAAESPVAFAGAPPPPPPGALRPQPRAPRPPDDDPAADREVDELTRGAADAWPEEEAALAARRDPRRHAPRPRAPRPAPPPRRAASAARAAARRASVAVQTVDTWPEPYEFLLADFYRSLPEDMQTNEEESREAAMPCERLDAYLSALYSGAGAAGTGAAGTGAATAREAELAEQLALLHAQLLYERWRREAHAERNRRLLGRCRHTRALELQNAALRDRLRAAARERDELRARRPPASPPPPPPPADQLERLDAALHAERAARARADDQLAEARAQLAAHEAQLHRRHAAATEAGRHVEVLARATALAERRTEHVRRLRRELLVLGEREARLREAGAAPAPAGEARALRAAAARAEEAAAAAAARADAAAARAHELEAALAARDAAVAELKRGARAAAEEGAARLRALQERYEALMRVVRAAETARLERLAAAAPARARLPPPSPSPPPADS